MADVIERRQGCALIGMVHLQPLPGSAGFGGDLSQVRQRAIEDACLLLDGGCDGLLVENMGDRPYLRGRVEPETTAAMAVCVDSIVQLGAPVGVQVLAAANREALGVATAAGAEFIRVEGFAYAHVADEGWIDASAGPLLRARSALSSDVRIWADVQKKHSAHAVTADLTIADLAEGAAFCGADAVVVTGVATGRATAVEDVRAAAGAGLPVIVGSGVDPDHARSLAEIASAVIVGSYLKQDGDWRNPVDIERVRALKAAL